MKPIPVVFHIGPLQVHTYGIGLALTFWFGFTYFERRLRRRPATAATGSSPSSSGSSSRPSWAPGSFHVISNLSYYDHNPVQVFAIWHGGLSSFGGLIFAVPTGILLTRTRCPELPISRALDLVAPVLMASWAMGRLLGPQLMVAGGGHPTHQWFGMYYAGQAGTAPARAHLPVLGGLLRLPHPHRH